MKKLGKKAQELTSAVEDVLREEGVSEYEFDTTGKNHLRLTMTVMRRRMKYVLPSTPSCPRSFQNNVSGVRRLVRQAKANA